MEGYFEYEVSFWDEVDGVVADRRGVTYAETCSEAAANIEDYYGRENIEKMSIFPLEPATVYELPSD